MDVIKEQTVNLEKVLFAVESVAVQDGTNKNRDEKCLKYKHCYFKEIEMCCTYVIWHNYSIKEHL